MASIKTQKEAVLNHLKTKGTITSMEAIQEYGATRLSAIIFELRHKDGYDIETRMLTGKNRFGNVTDYGLYIYQGGMKDE